MQGTGSNPDHQKKKKRIMLFNQHKLLVPNWKDWNVPASVKSHCMS